VGGAAAREGDGGSCGWRLAADRRRRRSRKLPAASSEVGGARSRTSTPAGWRSESLIEAVAGSGLPVAGGRWPMAFSVETGEKVTSFCFIFD
jgi:hypothetical protein